MTRLTKSVKDLIYYLLSGAAVRVFPLLFLPVIARMLNETDFGVFSLYRLYLVLGSALVLLGVEQGLFRLLPAAEGERKNALLSAAVYFFLITGLISTAIYLWGRDLFQPLLFEKTLPYPAFWLPALIVTGGLVSIVTTKFSAEKESRRFLQANLLRVTVFYLLFLAGLYLGYGLTAFFVAGIASDLLVVGMVAPILTASLRVRPDFADIRSLLSVGLPLMGVMLVMLLLYQSDHYLIKFFMGVEATGVYNYGYKFAAALSSFVLLTNNVWMPRLYEQGDDFLKKNLNDYSVLITTAAQGLYLLICGLFVLFAKQLIPQGFGLSFKVLAIAGAGYLFYGHSQLMDGWLILRHKSRVLLFASLVALGVNLILNVIYIPRYGLVAAAVTTTVTFILLWIMVLVYLMRSEKSFDFTRLIVQFGLMFLPAGIFLFSGKWSWAALSYLILAFVLLSGNRILGDLLNLRPARNE